MEYLKAYSWLGNVRELENRIQRAVIMCESSTIETYDLGFTEKPVIQRAPLSKVIPLKEARNNIERDLIITSLQKHRGNITKAAEELGISRPTFYDLIKKHSLSDMTF